MKTKKILFGMIVLSGIVIADLSRSDAGVVTDSLTGLQWQDDYSDNGGNIKSATWQDAIDYCEALSLDGHADWRLPNIRELGSIVDLSHIDSAIDPVFEHTALDNYWSSSTYEDYPNSAWDINFSLGNRTNYYKDDSYYIRCVRSVE